MDSESHEYSAVFQLYPGLVNCIKQSPTDLAVQLRPYGILADTDWEFLKIPNHSNLDKAVRIVDVILNQIKANPQSFSVLVSVLEAAGTWTKAIVGELKRLRAKDTHTSLPDQSNAVLAGELTVKEISIRNVPEPTVAVIPPAGVPPAAAEHQTPLKSTTLLDDLPGVEVLAKILVTVTNLAQYFYWSGYGFKLNILPGSLPSGVERCILHISVSLAGHYQLPDNEMQLVSPIFWVRPDPLCRFRQQLTVEIQHCVKMTSSTKLTFVRAICSQKSLPYTFTKVEEGSGSFSMLGSYGLLQVNHFSGYGIVGKDIERNYVASLFHRRENSWNIDVHFVITWDDEAHFKATKQYFDEKGAEETAHMEIEFEKSQISLNIPMKGVSVGEWKLLPMVTPSILQSKVNSFQPGKPPRSRKLTATLPHDCKKIIPECFHLVTLEGANEPNQMHIKLDAFNPIKSPDQSVATPHPTSNSPSASGSRSSQLVELCSRFNLSDDDIKKEVSDDYLLQIYPQLEKWKRVAAHLGLTRADVEAIESSARPDEELMRLYMLQEWKRKKMLDGTASYQKLLEALISCSCSNSAVQVCEMLSVHNF